MACGHLTSSLISVYGNSMIFLYGAFHVWLSRAGEIGGGLNYLALLLEFTQLNQNNRNTLSGLLESGQLSEMHNTHHIERFAESMQQPDFTDNECCCCDRQGFVHFRS